MYEQNVHIEEAPKEHPSDVVSNTVIECLAKMVNLLFTTRTVLKMQNGISRRPERLNFGQLTPLFSWSASRESSDERAKNGMSALLARDRVDRVLRVAPGLYLT